MLRRPLSYAIVDEVDSVLIDNCRNPQLISAPPKDVQEERQLANTVRLKSSLALHVWLQVRQAFIIFFGAPQHVVAC